MSLYGSHSDSIKQQLIINDNTSLGELKNFLCAIEKESQKDSINKFSTIINNGITSHFYFTSRLKKSLGKKWKSKEFLTSLKNIKYGYDPNSARSIRGRDGIFLLDRAYKEKNMMMRKIFDHFIDKKYSGFDEIAKYFNSLPDRFQAVRVVSHHMRILGVMCERDNEYNIILVDYDDTK